MKYKENLKRSQRKDIYYLQKSNNTFPGRLVLKEDSKWVAAAAAPHRGSLGGPGPHPGKENAGAEKGPGPGSEIGEEAVLGPHTEGVPGPQDDRDPHFRPLLNSEKS